MKEAIRLWKEAGEPEKARARLLTLVKKQPEDAQIQYQCAWVHDSLGLEREAAPYYEQALALGLSGQDRQGALLGLGSTYRCLGEYNKAVETLKKGVHEFPDNRALQVFLSMSLYNRSRHREAMEILLGLLVDTTTDKSIHSYEKAIRFYLDRLDQTWD